ncbi:MAG: glycerol-3-phosphate acyltransferase [Actinobacteria bacterium]|nr:glycerol-3-phosphate acyltransferase [Actinomycetota bacterium]
MEIIIVVALIIGAYLLGGIPFCYVLGKLSAGKDVREVGDHNVGAWNLIFNVNKVAGILGALLDAGKGALAYYIGLRFSGIGLTAYLCAVAAVTGHNWSPFIKFTGGKGIATTIGGFIAANYFTPLVFGIIVVPLLLTTKRMMIGILGAVLGTLAFLVALNRDIYTVIYAVLLLTVMAPKYIMESMELRAKQGGSDRRPVKDLFSAKPR